MKPLIILIAALISLNANIIYAGSPANVKPVRTDVHPGGQFINHKDWNFVENKGQLAGQNGQSQSVIKYYGHQGGVYLYCKPGMISFVFTKVENDEKISEATGTTAAGLALSPAGGGRGWKNPKGTPQPSKISTSRTDLVLLNSNPNAQIIATDQQEYYENFYTTGDADHGITNVHTYKTVTYTSIYPYIDMVLNAAPGGMEYSFIVHPGGKVSDIQMQWNGTEESKALASGGFKFSNSLSTLKESAPKSFVEGKEVESSFVRSGFNYGFKVGRYDEGKDLVIDPGLVWATYFGGNNTVIDNAIAIDSFGDLYVTGYTNSTTGIATNGAYATSNLGLYPSDYQAFLAKFDDNGKIQWATYYGGLYSTSGAAMATDGKLNVYMAGQTQSDSGIATNGAYNTTGGGGFLAKFSTNGYLSWGTYYTGYCYSVATDLSQNVYITGWGSYIAKFNSSGSFQWATSLGGGSFNQGYGVAADDSGNVFITGSTDDTANVATKGAYQVSNAGSYDAYLAKFNNNGKIQWATYYGGNSMDEGNSVAVDKLQNVYITGFTQSTSGIATKGAYQTSFGGNSADAFLAKFNSKGAIQWATYYGGSGYERGNCVTTDGIGDAYIAGYTTSSSGIATSNGYKTSYGGGDYDAFVAKFDVNGVARWASYYGSSGDDEGFGVVCNHHGNVYLSGFTTSSSGIATKGTYQTVLDGAQNVFLAKFNLLNNDAGISSISSPSGTFCSGKYPVNVTLQNNGMINLSKVIISWSLNGKLQPAYNWSGSLKSYTSISVAIDTFNFISGVDTIRAWTSKPNGVLDSTISNDTSLVIINVEPLPNPYAGKDAALCIGISDSLGTTAVTGYSYLWEASDGSIYSYNSEIVVNPKKTTSYFLREQYNSTSCYKWDTVKITVNPLPAASVISNTSICPGSPISIGATPVTGSSYSWASSPSGFSSTFANPSASPTSTTSYTLTETNSNGCVKSNSVIITTKPLPTAPVISDTAICTGSTISLGKIFILGSSYSWASSPSGFSSTSSNPTVLPTSTTSYTLTETNSNGCVKSNSVTITVNPLPDAHWTVITDNKGNASFTADSLKNKSYLWNFDNSYTAITASPITSYLKSDTYRVTLITKNNYGCSAEFDSTITIHIHTSGISEESSSMFQLSIYPNPFQSSTTIAYNLNHSSKINIVLLDITGKQIATIINQNQIPGAYQFDINAEKYHLTSGVYLLKFMMDDETVSRRLVKF